MFIVVVIVVVVVVIVVVDDDDDDDDYDYRLQIASYSFAPYKHSTSSPPVGLQRTATLWRPADPHPLGGAEVGCKVGLCRAAEGWPPLSLLFYLLAHPMCLMICHFTGSGLQQPT